MLIHIRAVLLEEPVLLTEYKNIVMGLVIHTMNVKILIVKHSGIELYGQVQEHVIPSMTTIRRLSMAWLSGSLIVKVLIRCMDPAT